MTRKDYRKIAGAIKESVDSGFKVNLMTVGFVTEKIAEVLREDNPRFDYSKFNKACGL